ncbi:hypothetical protein KY342_06245 [Candidatus Woesearchaeota archaeon]|nr:hypothetical protein [Candidatus Woesearchaeota archaeon]
MAKTSSMVYKSLVVGVIILFCGISVQPCIAIVQNNERLESNSEPLSEPLGDPRWLATLQVEFGEEISKAEIDLKRSFFYPVGNYYVHLDVNFNCPPDRKIFVKYRILAGLYIPDWNVKIVFWDLEETVTIVNGSNPPDINNDSIKYVSPHKYLYSLIIEANLTTYDYIDGEWVEVGNDSKKIDDYGIMYFINSRASETLHFLMKFFERFPNMEVFLRIMNLLR